MPAWPMPIQKTKLVMSKAQPTVRFRPQVPMPDDRLIRDRGDAQEEEAKRHEEGGPPQRPGPAFHGRAHIRVTWASDLSPSIRGGRSAIAASAMMFFFALLFSLLRAIAHDGQISHRGAHVEFLQHPVASGVCHHLADVAVGVVEVAEDDGLARDRIAGKRSERRRRRPFHRAAWPRSWPPECAARRRCTFPSRRGNAR